MKRSILLSAITIASISFGGAVMAEQTIGPESFAVSEVQVENFLGTINITVTSGDEVTVSVVGDERYMKGLEVRTRGNRLYVGRDDWDDIDGDRHGWFDRWFGSYSDRREHDISRYPVAEISVPEGMSLDLDGIAGRINIGDINGPLELSGWWLEGSIGNLTEAEVTLLGSGEIEMARVTGELELDVKGSGDITVAYAGSADIDILGSGDVTINVIDTDLEFSGKGSGTGTFGSVNGRVDVSLMGSGDVDIKEGNADPMTVSIMGSGDVTFGGTARHSKISQWGSGRVRIAHDNWDD